MAQGWGRTNIGALMQAIRGINPVDSAAATINGPSISTLTNGGASAVVHVACGAATGGPSAQTVDAKLQDSTDGSTGWTDIAGSDATQLTADNTNSEGPNVKVTPARRHLRAVVTVGFTGGAAPTIPVAATVVVGGSRG